MQASKQCCHDCPLREHGAKGFVPDAIPGNCEVLFRGDTPSTAEIAEGKPFVGKAGFVLKNWLIRPVSSLQILLERGKIGFSHVLKCMPAEIHGKPYPTGQLRRDAEEHCKKFFNMPDTVHTVVLCGDVAQRYHFPEELEQEDSVDRSLGRDVKGVMGRVGRVYEKDGKRWVFAPHPAFVLRQPALVGQGQEALKIAAGLEKTLEPKILRWDDALLEVK